MDVRSVFFDDRGSETAEDRRQRRMFAIFAGVIALTELSYGIAHYSTSTRRYLVVALIVLGSLQTVNWLAWRFVHHRLVPAKIVLTLLANVGILLPVYYGGIEGTAFLYLLAFPSATFLFQGLRTGLVLNVVYFISMAVVTMGTRLGLYEEFFYTPGQMQEAWTATIIMFILGYAAEKGWSDARGAIARQREDMRVLLQNMPAGVILFDAKDGKVVAANASAEQLLGGKIDRDTSLYALPERFSITKENGEPYPIEEMPPAMAVASGVASGRSDLFVKDAAKEKRVLRIVGAPVRNESGKTVAAVAVIEDATKEHEIDQMKSEFVSLASHQLKAPLGSISWAMEALLTDDAANLTGKQKTIIGDVSGIVGRLSRLVADLLNVSRIETGRKFNIVKKPTDVSALVAGLLKEAAVFAEQRKVALENRIPEGLVMEVDSAKCREVLVNLIGNAVKYSKEGGRVEVGATKTQKDVILYVQDDGVGIPAHQKERIFEKFFRAENVPEEIEGTGLGLYIVRAIVEKHGGRIWFSSEENKGTTFYAAFPLASERSS